MKDEMFDFYKNSLQGVLTNPLCADYRDEWRACGNDKEKLVKLVMTNCLNCDYALNIVKVLLR